jgi:hypothetical protein
MDRARGAILPLEPQVALLQLSIGCEFETASRQNFYSSSLKESFGTSAQAQIAAAANQISAA